MSSRLNGEGAGVTKDWFYDDINIAILQKSLTMDKGVSIIVQNCVTSFMDDPLVDTYGFELFRCENELERQSKRNHENDEEWKGEGWTLKIA
jgi:hypothetical protein